MMHYAIMYSLGMLVLEVGMYCIMWVCKDISFSNPSRPTLYTIQYKTYPLPILTDSLSTVQIHF